jgi:antitoxin component YwqK of YwqJK toxin-antitoxin module
MKYFISLTLILLKLNFSFCQQLVFESKLNTKNNVYILNSEPYSGFVISLYPNLQQKSIKEVKNGIIEGKVVEYWEDEDFSIKKYLDTSEINSLNNQIIIQKKELELTVKNSMQAEKEEIDYLNNEIGGIEKLQKLSEKNKEGKLSNKKKEHFDRYEVLVHTKNQFIRKVNEIEKEINRFNSKVKIENAKPIYVPKKYLEYTIKSDVKDGPAIIYDSIGRKFAEGNLSNNKINGKWKYFFSNGKIKEDGEYINGDDIIDFKSTISENGKTGKWLSYYENGSLESESFYKAGEIDGLATGFFVNGNAEYKSNYKSGLMNGETFFYFDNGKIEYSGNYMNDKENGLFVFYFENGAKKRESFYENGLIKGIVKEYDSLGLLKQETEYKSGQINGKIKTFYKSGKVESESYYFNKKIHGAFITYFENGNIQYKATIDSNSLAKNHLSGDFYSYKEDGTLKQHGFAYLDGRIEDKTPKEESKFSKIEMEKPYKCKCCKSQISGIIDAVDNNGNDFTQWLFELNAGAYFSLESSFKAFGYKDVYDYMRKREYPYCSLKCHRTCHE